jgi:hypothetical protein
LDTGVANRRQEKSEAGSRVSPRESDLLSKALAVIVSVVHPIAKRAIDVLPEVEFSARFC